MTALLSLCEGEFTPSRTELADAFLRNGAQATHTVKRILLRRFACVDESDPDWHCLDFLLRLNRVAGQPISTADKELAQILLAKGAGKQHNATVSDREFIFDLGLLSPSEFPSNRRFS
jgi:hypothetical protein